MKDLLDDEFPNLKGKKTLLSESTSEEDKGIQISKFEKVKKETKDQEQEK